MLASVRGRVAICAGPKEREATRGVEVAVDIAAGRGEVAIGMAALAGAGDRFAGPSAPDGAAAAETTRLNPAKTNIDAKSDRMIGLHAQGTKRTIASIDSRCAQWPA
jgi:hypothetical protein